MSGVRRSFAAAGKLQELAMSVQRLSPAHFEVLSNAWRYRDVVRTPVGETHGVTPAYRATGKSKPVLG